MNKVPSDFKDLDISQKIKVIDNVLLSFMSAKFKEKYQSNSKIPKVSQIFSVFNELASKIQSKLGQNLDNRNIDIKVYLAKFGQLLGREFLVDAHLNPNILLEYFICNTPQKISEDIELFVDFLQIEEDLKIAQAIKNTKTLTSETRVLQDETKSVITELEAEKMINSQRELIKPEIIRMSKVRQKYLKVADSRNLDKILNLEEFAPLSITNFSISNVSSAETEFKAIIIKELKQKYSGQTESFFDTYYEFLRSKYADGLEIIKAQTPNGDANFGLQNGVIEYFQPETEVVNKTSSSEIGGQWGSLIQGLITNFPFLKSIFEKLLSSSVFSNIFGKYFENQINKKTALSQQINEIKKNKTRYQQKISSRFNNLNLNLDNSGEILDFVKDLNNTKSLAVFENMVTRAQDGLEILNNLKTSDNKPLKINLSLGQIKYLASRSSGIEKYFKGLTTVKEVSQTINLLSLGADLDLVSIGHVQVLELQLETYFKEKPLSEILTFVEEMRAQAGGNLNLSKIWQKYGALTSAQNFREFSKAIPATLAKQLAISTQKVLINRFVSENRSLDLLTVANWQTIDKSPLKNILIPKIIDQFKVWGLNGQVKISVKGDPAYLQVTFGKEGENSISFNKNKIKPIELTLKINDKLPVVIQASNWKEVLNWGKI